MGKHIAHVIQDGGPALDAANELADKERALGRAARVHPRIVRAEGCAARVYVIVVDDGEVE